MSQSLERAREMSRVKQQFAAAQEVLAGGVSSSTRVNQALGHALLFDRAEGCRIWDLDGNEYIDLCCSHGATLLGHGDARVRAAVEAALARGAACSYESELHTELAGLLVDTVPSLERVRFTGSGTEATMHCIRLARALTGRTRLLKFEGNFHGYHDQVMYSSVPHDGGPAQPGTFFSNSSGMTTGLDQHLVESPYNDLEQLETVFQREGDQLAAAIIEPVYYNAGCVLPEPEFIEGLRRLTKEHGVVLIFDEVLAAFRMSPGGAQEHLGVMPDLCTLGKAVGGGYPLSVFGGRRDLMQRLMPQGDCQHSGTYNGHVVAVAAAAAAVRAYRSDGFYDHIWTIAEQLYQGLQAIFDRHDCGGRVQGLGARFGIYFDVDGPVTNYRQARKHNREKMLRFIAAAIRNGVYFHDYGGGAVHHGFCAATQASDVDQALERLEQAVAEF